jgi:DNA-binding NarL/FixJ family response regulator
VTVAVVVVGDPTSLPDLSGPSGQPLSVHATVPADRALPAIRSAAPAVVLIDLDASPAATVLVGQLAAVLPELPVVAVSDGPDQVLDVVRAGAAGYALRGDPELPAILRTAAAGGTAFGAGLAAQALEAAAITPIVPHLTSREAEVLQLVVEGLTSKQIATRLVLSPRTVENHIQRTLRKFDVPGRAALVRYAIENGLA